eukprot:1709887-Ditylum_brightwellii.AAC.2
MSGQQKGKIARVADQTQKADEADVRVIRKKDRDKEGNLYGNLMIRHLWKHQQHMKKKKGKYLNACLEQNGHFSPFVVSVDGMLGKEAAMVLRQLS